MRTLIKKGAEASLFVDNWHGRQAVFKARLPKKYRPELLDNTIRRYRTVHEPQLIHEARCAGVPTPLIFLVNTENSEIIMEFVEGKQVKQILDAMGKAERNELCERIGALIGDLHIHGIVHGDLTTSNMILTSRGTVFFIDFGLGERSDELEAHGVDLHLLKRALQSTHIQSADECFKAVMKGYSSRLGLNGAEAVAEKIIEIEKRGRYITERGQMR